MVITKNNVHRKPHREYAYSFHKLTVLLVSKRSNHKTTYGAFPSLSFLSTQRYDMFTVHLTSTLPFAYIRLSCRSTYNLLPYLPRHQPPSPCNHPSRFLLLLGTLKFVVPEILRMRCR